MYNEHENLTIFDFNKFKAPDGFATSDVILCTPVPGIMSKAEIEAAIAEIDNAVKEYNAGTLDPSYDWASLTALYNIDVYSSVSEDGNVSYNTKNISLLFTECKGSKQSFWAALPVPLWFFFVLLITKILLKLNINYQYGKNNQ